MKIIIFAVLSSLLCLMMACTSQDKSEAGVFFLKGNIQFKDKRFAEAIRFYDEAIKKYPKLTDAYLNKGLALSQLGKSEEAYAALSRALELEDGFHEARMARAEAALVLGRTAQAEDDLSLLTNVYKDSTRFYLVRGNLMVDKNQKGAAYADFDKAILLDPENVEALVNRGAMFFEDGKTKEAGDDFARALALNPAQKEALNNRGLVLLKEGNPGEALGYFEKVLIRTPDDGYALNNKGEALLLLGKRDEALKALSRSLEFKPDNAYALKNMGLYYFSGKDYENAARFLDKAVSLEQNVPGLYGLAGKCHFLLNNSARACQLWALGKVLNDSLAISESVRNCR
ncbi:tetratricopeptide repeat protein [Ravibacter arvi]